MSVCAADAQPDVLNIRRRLQRLSASRSSSVDGADAREWVSPSEWLIPARTARSAVRRVLPQSRRTCGGELSVAAHSVLSSLVIVRPDEEHSSVRATVSRRSPRMPGDGTHAMPIGSGAAAA